MNWKPCVRSMTACALALICTVCLTACSTGWAGVDRSFSSVDPLPQGVKMASLNPIKPDLPDPPKPMTKCFKTKLPGNAQGSDQSADARVLATMKENEILKACGKKTLDWYKGVQKANGVDPKSP